MKIKARKGNNTAKVKNGGKITVWCNECQKAYEFTGEKVPCNHYRVV